MNDNDLDAFNDLRQAILDKIVSVETTIQEAYFEERSSFDGSPAAVVGMSSNEALYESTSLDKVTFGFQIRIFIPIVDETHTAEVETRMGKAYWEVLRMFKRRDVLDGLADIVRPVPSIWGFEQRGDAVYRFAEINLQCVAFLGNQ